MTRNNSIWTRLLTSLGVFAVVVGLAGGVRAQQSEQMIGICYYNPFSDSRKSGSTIYVGELFRGIPHDNDSVREKKMNERNKEFLSRIRRKDPDTTIPPSVCNDCNLCGWTSSYESYVLFIANSDVVKSDPGYVRNYITAYAHGSGSINML